MFHQRRRKHRQVVVSKCSVSLAMVTSWCCCATFWAKMLGCVMLNVSAKQRNALSKLCISAVGKTIHTVQKGAVLLQNPGAVYKALCQTSLKHRREAAGLHGGLSFLQRITFHRPEASKSAQYLQHSMWILASESTQKSGQSLKWTRYSFNFTSTWLKMFTYNYLLNRICPQA